MHPTERCVPKRSNDQLYSPKVDIIRLQFHNGFCTEILPVLEYKSDESVATITLHKTLQFGCKNDQRAQTPFFKMQRTGENFVKTDTGGVSVQDAPGWHAYTYRRRRQASLSFRPSAGDVPRLQNFPNTWNNSDGRATKSKHYRVAQYKYDNYHNS